jgi:hypothetical protein
MLHKQVKIYTYVFFLKNMSYQNTIKHDIYIYFLFKHHIIQ